MIGNKEVKIVEIIPEKIIKIKRNKLHLIIVLNILNLAFF